MGLDLLLSPADPRKQAVTNLEEVRQLFARAMDLDEEGNYLEAYHYYRKVIDCLYKHDIFQDDLSVLLSQAFNNAAIILYDNGRLEMAIEYLQKAVAVTPNNQVAKDNLKLIRK